MSMSKDEKILKNVKEKAKDIAEIQKELEVTSTKLATLLSQLLEVTEANTVGIELSNSKVVCEFTATYVENDNSENENLKN